VEEVEEECPRKVLVAISRQVADPILLVTNTKLNQQNIKR
jgi:hypothetical protein